MGTLVGIMFLPFSAGCTPRRLVAGIAWANFGGASLALRPYRFVVLSDHGQSQGATFLQRYGERLEDVVRGALREPRTMGALEAAEEGRAGLGAALADVSEAGGVTARLARRVEPPEGKDEAELGAGGAVVLASGNLGLIYRHDGFAHTPDVLVNSVYDSGTGEVAAFEELVGSHGGLGGPQAHPFALVPSSWQSDDEPIVGAAAMHAALKRWIAAP